MKINKRALLIGVLTPIISIFVMPFVTIEENNHAIGFPIKWVFFRGTQVPENGFQLFMFENFPQTSFSGTYVVNIILLYFFVVIIGKIVKGFMKNKTI